MLVRQKEDKFYATTFGEKLDDTYAAAKERLANPPRLNIYVPPMLNVNDITVIGQANPNVEFAAAPRFGYIKTVDLGSVSFNAFDSSTGLIKHSLKVSYDMSVDTTTYEINSFIGDVVDLVGVMVAALPFPEKIAASVIGMLCINVGIYITGGKIKEALSATVSCVRTTYTWYIVDTKNTGHKNQDISYSYYVNDTTEHEGETFYDQGYFPKDWKQPAFGLHLYNKLFATPNVQIDKWEGDFDKSNDLNYEIYEKDILEENIKFGKINYSIYSVLGKKTFETINITFDKRIQTATYEFKNFMGSIIDMTTIIAASQQLPREEVKTFLQRFVKGLNLTTASNRVKEPYSGTLLCIRTTYIWHLSNVKNASQMCTFESRYSYINDTSIEIEEKDRNQYTNFQPESSWKSNDFAIYVYSLLFKESNRLFLMQNVKTLSWEK